MVAFATPASYEPRSRFGARRKPALPPPCVERVNRLSVVTAGREEGVGDEFAGLPACHRVAGPEAERPIAVAVPARHAMPGDPFDKQPERMAARHIGEGLLGTCDGVLIMRRIGHELGDLPAGDGRVRAE